nr:HlyD family efflux transporter periplasmic adaptor subunit [uncultured Agathobaculum sp.]
MEHEIQSKHKLIKPRKKTTSNNRLIMVVVAAIIVIYLVVKAVSMLFSYDTEPAVHVEVNDSFTATGWFFRSEKPVEGSTNGSVKHIVYSGERVQKDSALAVVYSDEQSLAISREIEPLENRLELLDNVLENSGTASDGVNTDQMITLTIQQMAAQAKEGSGTSLASSAESLRTLSLQNASDSIDTMDIQLERDTLAAEISSLEQQISGQTTELTAPVTGYFSEIVDGYENVLTMAELETLTIARFHELIQSPEQVDTSQTIGKMIEGFTWYLAAEVPAEQAQRLSEGQSLRVNFTQATIETPVTVYAIIQEHNSDTALLILEGTEFSSEMVSMRSQAVEIIIATYSGLKVPKSAVRMLETTDSTGKTVQQTGVYILSGGVQKAKIINPLYETEDYYVVEQSATNANMLVEQDQIIVRGRNLQNNMVVN